MTDLILASKSPFRAQILQNSGLKFAQQKAEIDERTIENSLDKDKLPPEDLASLLAEVKAQDVSLKHNDSLVLGCDQTLSIGSEVLHKAQNMNRFSSTSTLSFYMYVEKNFK